MPRKQRVKDCFDANETLNLNNPEYKRYLSDIFELALNYDIKEGDASQVPASIYQDNSEAKIIAKETGIVAGLEEIEYLLNKLEYKVDVRSHFKDGESIQSGDKILSIQGPTSAILSLERTILNFLQRLGGIATLTDQYVQKIGKSNSFITATRKTIWNMWDKKAVQCGGGLSHRLNLEDAAMLKENHLQKLKNQNGRQAVENSIKKILDNDRLRFLEIETTNLGEFRSIAEILSGLPDKLPKVIMFDHFSPVKIKAALSEAKSYDQYENIFYEASGNINLGTVEEYAQTGIDIISSGSLTQPGNSLDLSLLLE